MSQHRQHRCCTRFPLHSWGRNVFYPYFILNLSEGTGFWRDRNTISSRWEMSRNSTLGDQNAYGLQRICQLFCCQYDYNRHCQWKKKKQMKNVSRLLVPHALPMTCAVQSEMLSSTGVHQEWRRRYWWNFSSYFKVSSQCNTSVVAVVYGKPPCGHVQELN